MYNQPAVPSTDYFCHVECRTIFLCYYISEIQDIFHDYEITDRGNGSPNIFSIFVFDWLMVVLLFP